MNVAERNLAIQQTCDLIMFELNASGPADVWVLGRWLREQCAFEDDYMISALDTLLTAEKITYDYEDEVYESTHQ